MFQATSQNKKAGRGERRVGHPQDSDLDREMLGGDTEHGLTQRAEQRAEREYREAVAPEPLNFSPCESFGEAREDGRFRDQIRESDEVKQPSQAQILFLDVQSSEREVTQPRDGPGSIRDDCRTREDDERRNPEQPLRVGEFPLAPNNSRDDPEREDQLPGKGIKEPGSRFGPIRQLEAAEARRRIDSGGRRQRQGRTGVGQDEDRRGQQHEHDVHRQDIEISELLCQRQHPEGSMQRAMEHKRSAVFLDKPGQAAQRVEGAEDRDGRSNRGSIS